MSRNALPRSRSRLAGTESLLLLARTRFAQTARSGVRGTPPPRPRAGPRHRLSGLGAVVGRSFLILGGAFLVRAMTDAGAFPRSFGVALGLFYALACLVFAERAGRSGEPMTAAAYGVTATAIVYPLLWEATTRLEVLTPPVAACVLFASAAFALVVAARWSLASLAWSASAGAVLTALALLVSTHAIATFGLLLLLLAAVTLAVSLRRNWEGFPWPASLAADLVILEAAVIAGQPDGLPEAYAGLSRGFVLALVLSLPLPFLAATLWRALRRRQDPTLFDVCQTGVALAIGVGASVRVGPATGASPAMVGAFVLVLAAGLFLASSRPALSRYASRVFSWGGLLLLLAGSGLALPAAARGVAWSVMGLVSILVSTRREGESFPLHGAVLLGGSAVASGLLSSSREAFLASPGAPAAFSAGAVIVLASSFIAAGLLAARARRRSPGRADRIAALVCGLLALLGTSTLAERILASLLSAEEDPARVAAIRSAILAAAAVALSACRRIRTIEDLALFAYPVLGAGAVKLLVQDLPQASPSTLFFVFAAYGAALIAIPRFSRGAGPAAIP